MDPLRRLDRIDKTTGATTKPSATRLEVPNPVEFALSPDYLNLEWIAPRQATIVNRYMDPPRDAVTGTTPWTGGAFGITVG